jgi:hypothetical protein
VRAEWGVESAYCLRRCSKAGAPRDEEVVGMAGAVGAVCPTAVVVG